MPYARAKTSGKKYGALREVLGTARADGVSDTSSQGCTDLQSLLKGLDHRDTVVQYARACWHERPFRRRTQVPSNSGICLHLGDLRVQSCISQELNTVPARARAAAVANHSRRHGITGSCCRKQSYMRIHTPSCKADQSLTLRVHYGQEQNPYDLRIPSVCLHSDTAVCASKKPHRKATGRPHRNGNAQYLPYLYEGSSPDSTCCLPMDVSGTIAD